MIRSILLVASLAILSGVTPVRADDPSPARAAGGTDPATATSPRIRATHRVDVIAPGEKVESVIDRMRAQAATAVREGRPTDAPPMTGDRRGERAMDPRASGMPSGGMPAGSGGTGSPTQGSWPGMSPGMAPGGAGPRGDTPPPDRMRRR